MADSSWLVLRQANEAVSHHRPEEAHRLIEPLIAGGYRRAWRVAREIAREYAARAARSLDQHNPDAAWRDLLAAESLNTGEKVVGQLRKTLSRFGLVQVHALLEAGFPADAIAAVGRLRERGERHPDLARLESAAQEWGLAAELADRGEFTRALGAVEVLRPRLPCPPDSFDRFRQSLADRQERFRSAVSRLYDAAGTRQWREALAAADEVLAAAPEHREAQAIRGKAWLAATPDTADYLAAPAAASELPGATRRDSARPVPPPLPSAATAASLPKRFLLWVDGVGGYLVCLSNRVTFGQATGEAPIDVPLFADVSRLHAEIARDGEGYVVESGKPVLVNGKEAARAILAAGDRVTLGATCQFLFHKPVPVSSTARLELTSGHRLPVAVDGVLLMGNELMLGPEPNAHIALPWLPEPVLIYRSRDGLGVRVPGGAFRIDDRPCTDRAALPLPSVVSAEGFTFAVEAVPSRL